MTTAIRFLHQLAQALSTLGLYAPDHPATARSRDAVFEALEHLLKESDEPNFYFLGGSPVFAGRALHELAEWPWRTRFADVGIRRLTLTEEATRESLGEFLAEVHRRITIGPDAEEFPDEMVFAGVRFGRVSVVDQLADDGVERPDEPEEAPRESREFELDLTDELDAVSFIHAEAARGVLARAEADAVVRVLGAYLESHELPQAALPRDHLGYASFHAVNSALLAMAVGNVSGIDVAGRHRLGVAVLLHNIGMATLPQELIITEEYSPEDRARMERHTIDGARLLADQGGPAMELAAVVAFEHHLRPDGSGYPSRRFRPSPHWASRLAAACDAYVALRAPRPFRPAWTPAKAVGYLEEGAGTVFDAESAKAVAALVRLVPD